MIQGSWEFCSNHLQCSAEAFSTFHQREGPLLSSPQSFRESQSRPHSLYFSDDTIDTVSAQEVPPNLPQNYLNYTAYIYLLTSPTLLFVLIMYI